MDGVESEKVKEVKEGESLEFTMDQVIAEGIRTLACNTLKRSSNIISRLSKE